MKRWWFVAIVIIGLVVAFFPLKGNNIRITGEPVLTLNAGADSVDIGFRLSWENSWRDEFNWDAAWVFVKYKKENALTAWEHLNVGSVVVPSDLTYDFGKNGGVNSGVFIYRSAKGGGAVSDKEIHVKVGLNQFSEVTTDDIRHKKVYVAVSGIEMVYIPYGGYYLGDGKSHRSFRSVQQRIIPAEDDIIGTDPAFEYSCLPMPYYKDAGPAGAADRYNNASWVDNADYICHISNSNHSATVASHDISWTVNFKASKTIRTFGLSVANYSDMHGDYMPTKDWFLLASNDSLVWDTVCRCAPNEACKSAISYPVRHALRVQKPGSYQYYRLFFPEMNNGRNGYMLVNVAMSEKDLYPDATDGCLVESEKVVMGKGLNQLYAGDGDSWPEGTVFPDAYPKGYRGFYCMKYELSQEQYVSFLNMLDRTQQAAHIGNVLDGLKKGDYVFGDKSHPNARNGICVFSNVAGKPTLFANNLNPSEPYYGEDDGQTIACNYLTPADLLAYCDWCGLRPMSEMEYEKVCRRPYPQYSLEGEYAWNSRELTSLTGLSELVSAGTENETASGKNANAGNEVGPVRCGSFGVGSGLQSKAGAAFWGVMEMSGNLGELCYSAGSNGRGFNAADAGASHGNGVLAASGLTDMTLWPAATTVGAFCLRGGSFAGADSLLQVSDRSVLSVSGERDSTVGFRGVRTFSSERISVEGGAIACENGQLTDTACPGTPLRIQSQTAGSVSGMGDIPVSYMWYIDNQVIPGESGAELSYNFSNAGTTVVEYTVKRKTVSAVGEAMATQEVKVKVPNAKVFFTATETDIVNGVSLESFTLSFQMTDVSPTWEWHTANRILVNEPTFIPQASYFDGFSGRFTVTCVVDFLGCKNNYDLTVNVEPAKVLNSDEITLTNCGEYAFRDSRDNSRIYYTVKIGNQCWMATHVNVGERENTSNKSLHTQAGIQKYCYQNNETYCDLYGGMYTWYEATYGENTNGALMNEKGTYIQGICSKGWHIPTNADWNLLNTTLGGGGTTATRMKVSGRYGTTTWCDGNDCNSSGFNGLPLGFGAYTDTQHYSYNTLIYWWCASGDCIQLNTDLHIEGAASPNWGMYVRCIRD